MANFAQLNENSVVTQVIVVNNTELIDTTPVFINGVMYINGESEDKGIEFCKSLFGADTNWVQTSYNGSFRGKYAGIGDTYDAVNNIFSSPVVVPSADIPVIEPVVEVQQTLDIPALTTTDLQSLTTTGL
jgi:hypothetical protein